ncbi:MAG: hypothetical protein LBH60_04890 [Prevotellaceae bacterium]|jgi:hypothetical protein|nr:hypothetical protein [Prevotellaceae bacterium]
MPIKQITPMQAVHNYLQEQLDRREKVLLDIMFYTGEAGLMVARVNGSYTDRTGNLRSSTGYVVVKDGRVVSISDFTQVPPKESHPGDKYNGAEEGKKFAQKIISEFPAGIALIEVAGMNYSGCVSAKGFDVLDSAESEVERLFLQLLKQNGFIVK